MKRFPAFFQTYLPLHLAVILYGFTAILGKLISLSGTTLVWYRMLITLLSFSFFPGVFRRISELPPPARWKLAGIGVLMTLHWITFYEAIKYSNASITLSCLASASFFTSLIEPLIFKRRIRVFEMLLGALVIAGFVMIFGFSAEKYLTGMVIALISALLIALAGVFNKAVVAQYHTFTITWVEFAGGCLFMTAFMPLYHMALPETPLWPTSQDWIYLLILSLLCTTLAYTLTLHALRKVSAYTAALAINLEPVYGILMAYFFLGEGKELNGGFYAGTLLIILAVMLHPVAERYVQKGRVGSD